jgi:hypothetical protein
VNAVTTDAVVPVSQEGLCSDTLIVASVLLLLLLQMLAVTVVT